MGIQLKELKYEEKTLFVRYWEDGVEKEVFYIELDADIEEEECRNVREVDEEMVLESVYEELANLKSSISNAYKVMAGEMGISLLMALGGRYSPFSNLFYLGAAVFVACALTTLSIQVEEKKYLHEILKELERRSREYRCGIE